MSTDTRLWEAASMYIYSPTGRGLRGSPRQRSLATQVVRKLQQEIGEDEIGFSNLDANTYGVSYEGISSWGRNDIQVTNILQGDIAGTSIVLVHEGTHLVIDRHYVHEELDCRTLEILYFEDLTYRPDRWWYETRRGGWAASVQLNPATLSGAPYLQGLDYQRRLLQRDQLVDYVLSMSEYADSVRADWVRQNFSNWGGISNRWLSSKVVFMKRLAGAGGDLNARFMVHILMSIDPTRRSDWDAVVRAAGGIDRLRSVLSGIRRRLSDGRLIIDGEAVFEARQISNLETIWRVTL